MKKELVQKVLKDSKRFYEGNENYYAELPAE